MCLKFIENDNKFLNVILFSYIYHSLLELISLL